MNYNEIIAAFNNNSFKCNGQKVIRVHWKGTVYYYVLVTPYMDLLKVMAKFGKAEFRKDIKLFSTFYYPPRVLMRNINIIELLTLKGEHGVKGVYA